MGKRKPPGGQAVHLLSGGDKNLVRPCRRQPLTAVLIQVVNDIDIIVIRLDR